MGYFIKCCEWISSCGNGSIAGCRHSRRQKNITELGEKIDGLRDEVRGEISGLRGEIGGLRTELETIKVNHFGRLKNFLTELTSILLDKGIINNENRARLDNQLRDM
jgi:hypothetical protein